MGVKIQKRRRRSVERDDRILRMKGGRKSLLSMIKVRGMRDEENLLKNKDTRIEEVEKGQKGIDLTGRKGKKIVRNRD